MNYSLGSTGENVAGMQRWLTVVGAYDGRIDGLYGPRTEKAVRAWRNRIGLGGPGVFDADTMAASRRYLRGAGQPLPAGPKRPIEQVPAPAQEGGY